MASSLTSTYGTTLNPARELVTRHGFKGERQIITVSLNPSSIATPSGQTLLFRFPSLDRNRVVVPGTVRLSYDVTLIHGTDLTARFVANLGRAIIEKLSIKMRGQEVQSISSYGDYWAVRDMFLPTSQRANFDRLFQGCDDQADPGNLTLLRSGSSTEVITGANAALSLVFGRNPSKYMSPLDFELLTSKGPYHPSSFGDQLEYEITWADRNQVIISTDTGAAVNYSLTNIALQYETVLAADLANSIALSSVGRFALAFERIVRHQR